MVMMSAPLWFKAKFYGGGKTPDTSGTAKRKRKSGLKNYKQKK